MNSQEKEVIEVIGTDNLNTAEKKTADELLGRYYPKIKRKTKSATKLKLQVKTYDKDGPKKKYSLNLTANTPMIKFEATDWDWDFARALHKVLNKLLTEIEHKFHTSEQK